MQTARRLFYRLLKLYWRWFKPMVLGTRALVLRDGKILLVKMSYTEGWYLPGGGVDRGESYRAAILRELREECGIEAKRPRLFGLYHSTKTGKIDYVAVFAVTDFSEIQNAAKDPEISEAKFFPIRELPPDATPATRRRIHEYLHGSDDSDGSDAW